MPYQIDVHLIPKKKKHSKMSMLFLAKKIKYPCNYLSFDYDGMARPLDIPQTNDAYTVPTE